MRWLCCLCRVSLSLSRSCKSSDLNSLSCSSFSRRKPTISWLNSLLCFYHQCHIHLAPSIFMSLQIFPLLFFLISRTFFFAFSISDCFFFFVFASVLRSLSSNVSVRSQEVAHFQRALHPQGRYLFCFVFDLYLYIRVLKWSLRPRTVAANSSQ